VRRKREGGNEVRDGETSEDDKHSLGKSSLVEEKDRTRDLRLKRPTSRLRWENVKLRMDQIHGRVPPGNVTQGPNRPWERRKNAKRKNAAQGGDRFTVEIWVNKKKNEVSWTLT